MGKKIHSTVTHLLPFLLLTICIPVTTADELGNWLQQVNGYNPEYKKIQMDRDLAIMSKTKTLIEADSEEEELAAELTYFTTLSDILRDLQEYYSDVIDTLYGVEIENCTVAIAKIQYEQGLTAYRRAKELFQIGRVPQDEVEELRIGLIERENGVEEAVSRRDEMGRYFRHITGMEWSETFYTVIEPIRWKPQLTDWIENDLSFRRAKVAVQYAQSRLNSLPENAPDFDKKKSTLQTENARLQLITAEFNAKPNYEKTLLTLSIQKRNVDVVEQRRALEEDQRTRAKQQFEEGRISQEQYMQHEITALTTKRSYLEAVTQYMKECLKAMVTAGKSPIEVLQ